MFLFSMEIDMSLIVMMCVISAFRFGIINFYWVILVVAWPILGMGMLKCGFNTRLVWSKNQCKFGKIICYKLWSMMNLGENIEKLEWNLQIRGKSLSLKALE